MPCNSIGRTAAEPFNSRIAREDGDAPPRAMMAAAAAAGYHINPYTGGQGFFAISDRVILVCLHSGEFSLRAVSGKRLINGHGPALLKLALTLAGDRPC